jgi:hypothetical protein
MAWLEMLLVRSHRREHLSKPLDFRTSFMALNSASELPLPRASGSMLISSAFRAFVRVQSCHHREPSG